MASDTVRIKSSTHAKLREMAKSTGKSMPEVLDEAVEVLRRNRLLDDAAHAYAELRGNPKAWAAMLAEREVWEGTLADDLKDG